ncbi:MAG: FAD-binding protein [Rhizobiales bacterium]|nr:FAD-binding protein [Hyphomicrobiales bacterium]
MARKRDSKPEQKKLESEKSVSRRNFLKHGAVAGVSAAAVGSSVGEAAAQEAGVNGIKWDYEADVIVIGSGASGMPCAIRARDAGLRVLVIDQNFDVGGKMLHSGAQVALGGGDPVQLRDIAGQGDKEGFIKIAPLHKPQDMTEDTDFLFKDITDWSVLDVAGQAPYRHNERELHRAWADNCYGTRQFLMDNYVRFSRIHGTHPTSGISRARRATAFLMLGDKTDIKAGTVTRQDAGIPGKSSSHFAPRIMGDGSKRVGPGAVWNGAALTRCLEFSAREKGVKFMLNRRMTEIIREKQFSGRVLGVKASYTPRFNPDTGAHLESLSQNGNVDERRDTITIRAKVAVMIGSGGHGANPQFRSMFYPAFNEPAFVSSAWALLGPLGQDASGIIAGMRIGANLSGMQQNLSANATYHIPTRLATRDSYTDMHPGHPTFPFRRSTGITLGTSSYEHLIAVNQVGKRFYNEMDLAKRRDTPVWPGGPRVGAPKHSLQHVQCDWRNCSPNWVKQMYNYSPALDAAMAMNEGSQAPHYYSGPLWAIFDSDTIERDGWDIKPPFTADNGYFFSADTIEGLAKKIYARHEFQRVPLKDLKETVSKWNAYVDEGSDPDFGRGKDAPMHRIDKPPFYAAAICPVWHDSYGGLRINGKAQVVDMDGAVIPGLYCGGEASGGGQQHGLGRALVHGYIAGTSIAQERA